MHYFPSMGTPPPPLPASEKLGKRVGLAVVSLHWECQNLHDARPVARGSKCAVARQFFRNLHVWGTIVSDDSKGGAPKKLSTKDILAAARAQATKGAGGGEAAPAAEAPAPTTPAPATKTSAAKAPAPAKPAAGGRPKSTADILAAARAQAAGGAAPTAPAESAPAPAAKAPAPAKPAAGG